MNLVVLTIRSLRLSVLSLAALAMGQTAALASAYQLEGQNAGSSTWVSQNLQGWKELDYIPCRFLFTGGPISSQTVTIYFPHLSGTTPGFENLTSFTPSPNLVILAGPTLSTPASGTWSYTMTVQVTDGNPASVQFLSRLAAGAHLNTGSSLMLSADPTSAGELQIHKPAPGPNLPDLAIVKAGAALARPGDTITYTLSYTNKAPAGATTAVGTQISDILPPELTVDPSTISDGGVLIGNTIFWDLGDLMTAANGMVSFQALVNAKVPYSHSFTNFSQILSAENDANTADNTSTFVTTTIPCTPPSVSMTPQGSTNCSGQSVTFTAVVTGSGPLTFVWSRNGLVLSATNNSLVLPSVDSTDVGTYAVLVSNACGSATTSAVLALNQSVGVSQGPLSLTNCPGTTASFSVSATGTGLSYQWYKGGALLNGKTGSSLVLSNVSIVDTATYSAAVGDLCGNAVTNSASLTVTALPVITCATDKTVQLGTAWGFDAPVANYPLSVVNTTTNTTAHCGNTFSATRTWVATDACGNVSSPCSQTVNVVDTTAPVLDCSSSTNKIVQLGSPWSFDPPGVTDNSGTNVTLTIVSTTTNTTAHCGNAFSATRTWAASDACGNVSSPCSQTVNVVDTQAPVLDCSSSTNKTVQLGSAWSFDPPTVTDNSGTNVTLTIVSTTTNTTAHCGNTFSATRTWAASDACGNVSGPCSQTVNVVDTTAPTLDCSSSTNKTVQLGSPWSFDPPTVTDNSGTNVTLTIVSTITNTTAHCGNTFSATRTWAASDACGNVSSPCSQTVNVVDTQAPVLDCSSSTNKTVQLGSAWSFDPPTVTDNSGTNITLTIVSTTTNTTAHCGNTFSATRTWAASDACGNVSGPCSQTVNVVDTTAPVLDCSSSTNKTVQLGSAWSFDPPGITDNSGTNITLTIVSTITNTTAHCGNTFSATRTWAASDACGNVSGPCSQTVNVVDTQAPVLDCSSSTNKTVQLGSAWSFDPPTVTDNSGTNITLTIVSTTTNTTAHCGNTFSATRTWAASDACGNVSGPCSQTVNVVDTTAPVLDCSSSTNKTVQLGSAWSFDAPSVTDNSGTNVTLTIVSTTTNTTAHCGNTFSATRTWAASDACGNVSGPCSQTVNVVDTTAPVLDCSSSTNKTVQLGSAWSFDPPTVTDNSGTNITLTIVSTTTNTTAHCGNTFSATRTWAASDACGNVSGPCSQTVNVVDTTAPVLDCSSSTNKTVQLGSAWSFDPPTVTDNSGTNITLTIVSTTTNTTAHCGNTFSATRTWAASDACGNISSPCSQTVNVVDTTAPVLDCSSSTNKTVQLGSAWSFDPPSITDNSGTNVTLTIVSTTTNTTAHCGNTFSATRTWAASDACGNVSGPCSQTVNVVDTTAPTLDCSSSTNKTVQLGSAWSFDPPSITDNSGTNITLTIVSTTTNTTAHCGNTFSATRTWAASDACGNVSSPCSQTVNVVDTTAPVLDCSSSTNKTVQLGSPWSFDPPGVTDNSGTNVTLTIVSTTTNTTAHCGNTFSATRTWAASDACGNVSGPCSQTVNVVDTQAPVLDCSSSTNKTVQLGSAWSFDPPGVTDNSGTNITLTIVSTTTNTAAHCGNTFSATRTWVAADACGNVSSPCSQTVNVVDTTAPVLDSSSSTNKIVQLGSAWSFDPPSITDNSGTNVTLTIVSTTTNTTAHCGNTFSATRTWVASDVCGNVSSPCSQTVNVVDTTAPVLDSSSSTNKIVQLGSAWSFDPPSITDNSGTNVTLTIVSTTTNTTAHCGNTFSATRTWVASDVCGNVSSPCSQTVNVVDTTAPVLDCSSSTNKTVQLGSAWSFDPPTATDNGGTNITLNIVGTTTNTTGLCGDGYNATRTWVASDACGNVSSACSQTVTVTDSAPIMITSPLSDQTSCAGTPVSFHLGAVGTSLSYSWSLQGSVLGTNSTLELTNVSAANAGTYQVVVSDICGDSATNTATLTVNPLTTATPLTGATRNVGDSVTFSTVAAGTGPFTYAWMKDGAVIGGQTNSSLTLTNLGFTDGAVYEVDVTGSCNTVVQRATLTINHPPVVTILSPTNGTVFMAPASFTVLADAYDTDGTVTNVEFFQAGLGKLGETNVAPYFINLTNLAAGSYTFTARATDNLGAQGTSSPVSVTVLSSAPLTIISALRFNPQTGLFEQTVRVTNPTPISYDAVRVSVYNLTNGMRVWNASGTNSGVPYVQTQGTVASGSHVDFVIEYYVSSSQTPNPTLVAALVEPSSGGGVTVVGTSQRFRRALMLSDKTFLLEFNSVSNQLYYIQYTSDLKTWQTVQPPIAGTGADIQWIDNGQPKTVSAPAATPVRFYRLISLQ